MQMIFSNGQDWVYNSRFPTAVTIAPQQGLHLVLRVPLVTPKQDTPEDTPLRTSLVMPVDHNGGGFYVEADFWRNMAHQCDTQLFLERPGDGITFWPIRPSVEELQRILRFDAQLFPYVARRAILSDSQRRIGNPRTELELNSHYTSRATVSFVRGATTFNRKLADLHTRTRACRTQFETFFSGWLAPTSTNGWEQDLHLDIVMHYVRNSNGQMVARLHHYRIIRGAVPEVIPRPAREGIVPAETPEERYARERAAEAQIHQARRALNRQKYQQQQKQKRN